MKWLNRGVLVCCLLAGDSLDPQAYPLAVVGMVGWALLVWGAYKAKERRQDRD